MNNLDKEHYISIVDRGLINKNTKISDFIAKIDEEFNELKNEYNGQLLSDNFIQEAIDLRQTVTNMLIHYNVNIQRELIKNINRQKQRINE